MPSFPLQEERRLGKAVACQRLKVHRITKLEGVRDHPVQYTVDGETGRERQEVIGPILGQIHAALKIKSSKGFLSVWSLFQGQPKDHMTEDSPSRFFLTLHRGRHLLREPPCPFITGQDT